MIILCREQKTSEWHGLRCGRVTASNMWRAMNVVEKGSKVRGDKRWESGAERKKYIRELAWELITHTPTEHYVTEAMDLGNQFESQARTEYWMTLGQEVDQTGLVRHPTLPFVAASPDGLVGDTGGVEIKVPLLATHQQTLIDDAIPEKYVLQMQANMMCCEREWWDFVSYAPPDLYPELPEEFRLYVKRLPLTRQCIARWRRPPRRRWSRLRPW